MNKERNVGLDLAKVIACISVVFMHTFRNVNSAVTGVIPLYYLTRCAMPIFFMAVGYIQLNRIGGGVQLFAEKNKEYHHSWMWMGIDNCHNKSYL